MLDFIDALIHIVDVLQWPDNEKCQSMSPSLRRANIAAFILCLLISASDKDAGGRPLVGVSDAAGPAATVGVTDGDVSIRLPVQLADDNGTSGLAASIGVADADVTAWLPVQLADDNDTTGSAAAIGVADRDVPVWLPVPVADNNDTAELAVTMGAADGDATAFPPVQLVDDNSALTIASATGSATATSASACEAAHRDGNCRTQSSIIVWPEDLDL
jgi:hypothetical protein